LRVLDGGRKRELPPDVRSIVRLVLGLAVVGAGTLITALGLILFYFVRALFA
jgi:hypothetical protein